MLLVSLEKGRFGIAADGLYARVSPDSEVDHVEIDAATENAQLAVGPYHRLLEWPYGTSSSGRPLLLVVAPEAGFLSPACAPSSRFAAARPWMAAKPGSIR